MTRDGMRQVVDAYFAAIKSRDVQGLTRVFAEDAVLESAAGTVSGRRQIAEEFYAKRVFPNRELVPVPGEYVIEGNRVAVEIRLRLAGTDRRVADFFVLESGTIRRLSVYVM